MKFPSTFADFPTVEYGANSVITVSMIAPRIRRRALSSSVSHILYTDTASTMSRPSNLFSLEAFCTSFNILSVIFTSFLHTLLQENSSYPYPTLRKQLAIKPAIICKIRSSVLSQRNTTAMQASACMYSNSDINLLEILRVQASRNNLSYETAPFLSLDTYSLIAASTSLCVESIKP